jgi:hypothetical protein
VIQAHPGPARILTCGNLACARDRPLQTPERNFHKPDANLKIAHRPIISPVASGVIEIQNGMKFFRKPQQFLGPHFASNVSTHENRRHS